MKKLTTLEWISKAKLIHGNIYDYSKVCYISSRSKVTIICSIHGEFEQQANSHLQGKTCLKCKLDSSRSNNQEFADKANVIHYDKYNYSKVKYNTNKEKVCITCLKHGDFWQSPNNHLTGAGCPLCNYSKGELLIYNWLNDHNIKFKTQFELITTEIARDSNVMRIDFFVKHNEKQYFIEYDGEQHFMYKSCFHNTYEDFEKQQRRDRVLNEFCELHKNKVTLIRFTYKQTREEIIIKLNTILND